MSPIIRQPDGPDPITVDVDTRTTPFPEDINARSDPTDVSPSKSTESAEDVTENTIEMIGEETQKVPQVVVSNTLDAYGKAVPDERANPSPKSRNNGKNKRDTNLRRSQSLKTQVTQSTASSKKKKSQVELETQPSQGENDTVAPLSKTSKPGKFKMLRSRFTVFPKASSNTTGTTDETKEASSLNFHNLRRSHSMKIPQKKTSSASQSNSNFLRPANQRISPSSPSLQAPSKNSIKNSKSMCDVRHYAKKGNNVPNSSVPNGALNNATKRISNTTASTRLGTLPTKIKNSTDVLATNKESNSSRNFAYKTIDVIRKSVQGKLKGNVEKRAKANCSPSIQRTSRLGSESPMQRKATTPIKPVSNVKINSKRKQIECNDSDTEFKPKKKISSKEDTKSKLLPKERSSKENRITSPSSRSREQRLLDKHKLETTKALNKKNNDKTALNINKRIKEDKNAIININNYNNNGKMKKSDNGHKSINPSNDNKDIIYTSITSDSLPIPIPELQSHHALFLSNIHETLSNSCREKHKNIPTKNLNNLNVFSREKSLDRERMPLNRNIFEAISSRLSGSLPFLAAEAFLKGTKTPSQVEETNLTKSLSEIHISEKSTVTSLQEVDMKSMSPMSISNSEDERSKTGPQSPMSFVHYDPYIDESMEDYWNEEEGSTYFGTLFAESKFIWESFGESLTDLSAADMSPGSYYLENDLIVKPHESGQLGIDKNFLYGKTLAHPSISEESQVHFSSQNDNLNNAVTEKFPAPVIRNEETGAYEEDDSIRNFHSNFTEETLTDYSLTSQKPLQNGEDLQNEISSDAQLLTTHERGSFVLEESNEHSGATNEIGALNHDRGTPSNTKPLHSKRSLDDPTTRRKNLKNTLRTSAANSTNRINKRIKQLPKQSGVSEVVPRSTRVHPLLRGGKKALSQDLIIPVKEKQLPMRKEKSELEYLRRETDLQEGLQLPKEERKGREIRKSFSQSTSALSKTQKPDAKTDDEKKRQDFHAVAAARRSKIDSSKMALGKAFRGPSSRTKQTDPVKVLRPTAPPSQTPSQGTPSPGSEQLKRLEAELSARTQEAQSAKEEATRTGRGLEALTVLVHHLTKEYDAFSSPKLKAEVERLTTQLTDIRLCLDESSATTRRLQDEATERCQKQAEEREKLEEVHCQEISTINLNHQKKLEEVLEKHQLELKELLAKEEEKRQELIKSHKEELERIDNEWRAQMDKQHERHLQALEQLNTCHTQQLREVETSWESRERDLQETNTRLLKEQASLRQQTKRLEETLMSDKDHRLQAIKNVCAALRSEVDSLKTVVEMRNSEVHKLRDQLADKERITDDLDAARERVRALQAKTEDLHAQMEKKLHIERQLIADHHSLADSLQREASVNKRLSLENEELQWKLRQREAATGSLPTSTLEMVTRCSSAIAQQQEGCKTGALSPQFTPRSQRIGTKPHDKKWSRSFSNIPEDAGKFLRRTELQHDDVTIESPPPSPRVKAVIEKSNSVSFILDLNDTFPEQPFLGGAPPQSPLLTKKPRTPVLQRKPLRKAFSNLEKSSSASLIQGGPNSSSSAKCPELNGDQYHKIGNGAKDVNGDCQHDDPSKKEGFDRNHHSTISRDHSPSESSDGGDIERISPTGMAWTVPVHSNMKRYAKHIPNRFHHQVVPEPPRLLQQPDEDEYEEMENENEFVEVLTLGDDLSSAPLTTLFAQTPSTSVSLSDSDISQCGSRADLSSEDDCSDDDGTLLQKDNQCRPQEGAGEAMIFPDAFDMKAEKGIEAIKKDCKEIAKSQISSAPSSDSEDVNQPMNEDTGLNMSWSEDVECDLTSSSEMQELL